MSIASTVNFEISPLNQSSGSNAGFSYTRGNPVISLRLPAANNLYLLTDTLRLNYVLTLYQPDGVTLPTNSLPAAAGQVLISDRIGSNAIIDSISVTTATNSEIESCRNYGRLLASTLSAAESWNGYSTHLSHWFGGVCSSNKDVSAKVANRPIQCSSPLLTGVLGSGQAIPLGNNGNGCGGMIITIQLNSNNQALMSSSALMAGAQYRIEGVTLTGKYGIPVGGVLPPLDNIRFEAYQSYYDVINTNDHTGSIDSRLGAVKSVFSNFIGTTSLQNLTQDSFQTTGLNNLVAGDYTSNAAVRTINFMRNGVKYPLNFAINETQLAQNLSPAPGAGSLNGARLSSYDTLRQYYYQDAVRMTRDNIDAMGSARSEGLLRFFSTVENDSPSQVIAPQQIIQFPSSPAMGRCFGIGIRYDGAGIGNTASFKQSPYSYRVTSDLDGISPTSIFTYFQYTTTMTLHANGMVDISS
jgi:hypothetical protein